MSNEPSQLPATPASGSASLKQYQVKRDLWISWLAGDDRHAIWRQISSLLLDYAFFQTLNDLRKEADRRPLDGVGFNRQVLCLLDAGFVAIQANGIRKLLDRRKDVISLKRLLDDIRESRSLLTRENYLACLNLPYAFQKAKEAHFRAMANDPANLAFRGLDTEGPNAWPEAEMAHERFDKLSRTTATARSKGDLVSVEWLDRLDSRIKDCENVRVFTNKFTAHAADPLSRAQLTPEQCGVTLRRLADCHQALLEVAEFAGCRILQCNPGAAIPTPSFDLLEHLDKAWTPARDLEEGRDPAGEAWEHNRALVETWGSEALNRFESTAP
jgi:hypothetical protein